MNRNLGRPPYSRGIEVNICVPMLLLLRLLIAALLLLPAERLLAAESDSLGLYGTWSWNGSIGGIHPDGSTPSECGCRRLLTLAPGQYQFIEQDSSHQYLLCEGTLSIRQPGQIPGGSQNESWVTFGNWWVPDERNQCLRVVGVGTDTLLAYSLGPGYEPPPGSNFYRFVRVATAPVTGSNDVRRVLRPLRDRPPRWEEGQLLAEGEFPYYEVAPVPISHPEPAYPDYARKAQIQGQVILHVLVGKDGHVKNIKIVRGVSGLSAAAVNAVKNWVYKPALSGNRPVAVWIEVPVLFRL